MADEGFTWDLFLSHSSADKAVVTELRSALVARGVSVWLDADQIGPGDSIPLKVEDGVNKSRAVAICMSPAFWTTEWTAAERAAFLYTDPSNAGRTTIPILVADCDIPRAVQHLRFVDYRERQAAAVDEILGALVGVGSAAPTPHKGTRSDPIRDHYRDSAAESYDLHRDAVREIRNQLAVAMASVHETSHGLVVLDLDGFTNMNRRHGSAVCNALLKRLTWLIDSWCAVQVFTGSEYPAQDIRALRSRGIAPLDDARIRSVATFEGADEWFVYLGSRRQDHEWLVHAAQALVALIASQDLSELAPGLYASTCAGSAIFDNPSESALSLLRRSVQGLAVSKKQGSGMTAQGPPFGGPLPEDAEIEIVKRDLSARDSQRSVSYPEKPNYSYGTSVPSLFGTAQLPGLSDLEVRSERARKRFLKDVPKP